MDVIMDQKDELLMRLVNYFITEKNYAPIVVNGVRDEIWLQNQEGPYKIIRINANYIHNKEQYEFDLFKVRNVMRQVKRKTLSWSMNTLNILLNVNENVSLDETKNIESVYVKSIEDIESNQFLDTFPDIQDKLLLNEKGLDLIFNVTNNINRKTAKENKVYENIFKPKKIVVTYALIVINVIVFFLTYILSSMHLDAYQLLLFGGLYTPLIKAGEIWRLVTSAFLHANLIHLLFNMYSLYVIGTQVENFIGKKKFLFIYFISLLSASLMSAIMNANTNIVGVGASGAIFGLLGALLYFGFHYRVYLGSVLRNQIIPLIIINLIFGFVLTGVDNAAHIGGLVGGVFAGMVLGIQKREKFYEKINGAIVLTIYLVFLTYVLFFR